MLSAGVKIENLDYLAPSALCIKPVSMPKPPKRKPVTSEETSVLDELREETALKEAVKISLNDCLACSGCVTTSETILVRLQSVEELYKQIRENKARTEKGQRCKKIVVSLSAQACASVAAYFRCSLDEAFHKLLWIFHHRLGVSAVTDGVWALNISLLEISREFVARFEANKKAPGSVKLPLMASACPGWICYAEKTHPELLPYISTTKSPQAVAGTVIKRYFAQKWSTPPEEIYHLAVYACFDKKLEASRPDFQLPSTELRETDCVLAALEIPELLAKESVDWGSIPTEVAPSSSSAGSFELLTQEMYGWDSELSSAGSSSLASPALGGVSDFESSGGYLEFVFRYAARALFGQPVPGPLPYQQRRNANWQDVSLTVSGEKVLNFATAYGFQQIQNLTRQLSGKARSSTAYSFVEVMACPSGCLNGGGQIKAAQQRVEESNRELLPRVQALYREHMQRLRSVAGKDAIPVQITPAYELPTTTATTTTTTTNTTTASASFQGTSASCLYLDFAHGGIYSPAAQALFHTQYHAVQKTLETQGTTTSPTGNSSSSSSSPANMIALNAGW